jgi:hypothetical protein
MTHTYINPMKIYRQKNKYTRVGMRSMEHRHFGPIHLQNLNMYEVMYMVRALSAASCLCMDIKWQCQVLQIYMWFWHCHLLSCGQEFYQVCTLLYPLSALVIPSSIQTLSPLSLSSKNSSLSPLNLFPSLPDFNAIFHAILFLAPRYC